jgi:hypothetical protein
VSRHKEICTRLMAVVILAVGLALISALPSAGNTQRVSAQSYITCSNGEVFPASFGLGACANGPSGYVICNGIAVPVGTTCSVSTGQFCGATAVPSGSYCCPNGNVIPIGAMCTNTAPQYCGATLVPTGDVCCPSGSVVAASVPCTEGGGTPCGNTIVNYPQTCQSQICPNGTVVYAPSVCPGATICPGGTVVDTPSTCPVATSCPNGTVVYTPETCPLAVSCSNGTVVYAPNTCPTTQLTYCANGVTVALGQQCPTVTVTNPAPTGLTVTYSPGWNLVAGPTGTVVTGNIGPLYAFRPGDSSYEVIPTGTPLTAGTGYWAYFSQTTTSSLGSFNPGSMTEQLPAGQFVMVGNPGAMSATVSGADIVYTYSVSAGYQRTTTLAPGQGAWAFSANGGTVSLTSSAT